MPKLVDRPTTIPKSTLDGEQVLNVEIPYTPQPHQLAWHNCQTRFLVSVCGRQIGKTTAAVNELVKRALTNKGTRNWYVTNDYRQAKRNVWEELKRYIPRDLKPIYNNSELSVTFPIAGGSKIELIGVENADSLRGAVVHFMILDEYADFPSQVWPEVLRPMLSTTAGNVWFIGTPKGFNHFYELYSFAGDREGYTRFNIPSCVVDEQGRVLKTTNHYARLGELQSAHDSLDDNSWLQEYMGEFNKPSGTVYKEWDLEHYKPLEYDPNLPLHVTMDYGVNDPTVLLWLQPNHGEVNIIDHYEVQDSSIENLVSVINSKPYKKPELYTGDQAGHSRIQGMENTDSPIAMLAKKGIYVRTKPGLRIPDQIRTTHTFMSRLFVDSVRCERVRDCILNYRYPNKSETAVNQENEIPIHDQYSHTMRALEYWAANFGEVPHPNQAFQNNSWRFNVVVDSDLGI